jgi:hypothetical protein
MSGSFVSLRCLVRVERVDDEWAVGLVGDELQLHPDAKSLSVLRQGALAMQLAVRDVSVLSPTRPAKLRFGPDVIVLVAAPQNELDCLCFVLLTVAANAAPLELGNAFFGPLHVTDAAQRLRQAAFALPAEVSLLVACGGGWLSCVVCCVLCVVCCVLCVVCCVLCVVCCVLCVVCFF